MGRRGEGGGRFGSVPPRRPLGGNAELLAREVDPPIPALVPAALPPVGDMALVVAPARALQRFEQRLLRLALRDLGEVGDRAEPRARRLRTKLPDAHYCPRTRRTRSLLCDSRPPLPT